MHSRAWILERVRAARFTDRPLPALPGFAPAAPATLAAFGAALARMGGTLAELPDGCTPESFVRERHPQARVICSATPEVTGSRDITSVRHGSELEDVEVGVLRAAFGVAETGSVWLSERELGVAALGFLAQHLVVLLDPRAIVGNLHEAYRHAGFRQARYAVLMSGPSATADIEGVLIRGAQGVRTLTVLAVAQAAAAAAPSPDRPSSRG